jgi:hypothetical protein
VQSDNVFLEYAELHLSTYKNRHAILQLQQWHPSLDDIPTLRCQALLSFDFLYGDFARWLGGEYTNSHCKLDLFEANIAIYHHVTPVLSQLPLDCDRLIAIMREGILLQGKFECKQDDLLCHLKYDNHPPLQKVLSDFRQAFAKEEAASYHIHLQRFIAHFIYGLFLCPIS